MGHYDIKQVSEDCFDLYEDGAFLCMFSRDTFRESLTGLGRSSNWVGSILRLFNKKYPLPFTACSMSKFERALAIRGESGFAEYLRFKGFKVVKPLDVTDREIIDFLESKGYIVEGLLTDVYYETRIYHKSRFEEKRAVSERK